MIVIGYQGIGKSSTANNYANCIDLESSNFFYKDVRPENWYAYYGQIADHLSKQKNIVFVSSHKEVREFLRDNSDEKILVVHPAIWLKDEWIKRLSDRYDNEPTGKNYKALQNAIKCYNENQIDLSAFVTTSNKNNIQEVMLTSTEYDLYESVLWDKWETE